MSSGTNRTNDRATLMGISSTRRHIYFYVLLLLSTIVGHNLWRANQTVSAPSMAEMHTIVATASHMNP